MRRVRNVITLALVAASTGLTHVSRADDAANAVIDKAIDALGGAEKLNKAKGVTWAAKSTVTFGGNEFTITSDSTALGLDQFKGTFSGEFNGQTFEGTTVVNKTRGWRKIADMSNQLDDDQLDSQKRSIYMQLLPMLVVPLRGKEFKLESLGEEKDGDITLQVIKVTGPDGKDFKLSFDKTSGLPARVEGTVSDGMGSEFNLVSTYKDFKEFGGVRKATKITSTRDGEPFIEENVSEFKTHETIDPKTFDEPQ
jgi:hypothetical protein